MNERTKTSEQPSLDNSKRIKELYPNVNTQSTSFKNQKSVLKSLSANYKLQEKNRLAQFFFPTRSRIKLHQSQLSTGKQTIPPLNEQVARLNQRADDVRTGIEHSISSLHTQRSQHLTALNQKTRDFEKAAVAFEYSSSKHLKQELNKTKKLSYMFKIAIILCLSLFSFIIGYMIIKLMRDKGLI